MNKSNFLDIGKTFLIIIFFLIIIGLIIIVTDPIKFNTMLFGNRVIEGMAPSVNQCHDCVIEPKNGDVITRFKPIDDPNYIKNRIAEIKSEIDIEIQGLTSADFTNDGKCTNLYADTADTDISSSVHYVFCSWKGVYNTLSADWLNLCSNSMYNDSSCCSTNDNNRTNFYKNNYLVDTHFDNCYNGILFKYNNEATIFKPLDISNSEGLTFVRGRFRYNTDISSQNVNNLTISSLNKQLNCFGQINTIPSKISPFGDCNTPAITELSNTQQMNLEFARQKCWNLGTQIGMNTMMQECSFNQLHYTECSGAYLPNNFILPQSLTNPPDYTAINNILNSGSNRGGVSGDGASGADGIPTSGLSSPLEQITNSLITAFDRRLDNLNIFLGQSGKPEFSNIGTPTYLNLGSCDNNSPYVYNSSCSNNSQTNQSGGFLYQYQCYPSLTGQFKDCGPVGYQAKPQF